MNVKERLMKLIKEGYERAGMVLTYEEAIADNLLENGVVVLPCKVGDKVYSVVFKSNYINESTVVGFHLGKFPDLRGHRRKEYLVCYTSYVLRHIEIEQIGKTVFFTREEAEKALVERSEQ